MLKSLKQSFIEIKISSITILLGFVIFFSCEVQPKKINYGNDHCHFCDMTVVDKTHAAQYVTKKGKTYTFDAIECMVHKLNNDNNEKKMSFLLVTDYSNPGNLINAKTATYLISEKIKSPMGENLSAFSSKKNAQKTLTENTGELFTWRELKSKFLK